MKKVLLFTLEYPPDRGGVATYLHDLHKNLPNVSVARARTWWLWPWWTFMIAQLWYLVRKEHIELVAISHVLPVGYAALFIKRFLGIPYIVFTHGLDVQYAVKNSWKRYWFQKIMANASRVVTNSEYTKSLLMREKIPENDIEIVLPCVRATMQKKLSSGHALLSVGRLVARKNHGAVLSVLPSLIKDYPDLHYTIVGDGSERAAIRAQITELHVQDHVTLITDVSDQQRDEQYESADIFVLPTYSKDKDVEGFGMVFLEAARFGLPVVAGKGGGVEEAVRNEETGVLVDPDDVKELERALRDLLENPKKAREMGERGRMRVEHEFLCGLRIVYMQKLYD